MRDVMIQRVFGVKLYSWLLLTLAIGAIIVLGMSCAGSDSTGALPLAVLPAVN